MRQYKPGDQIGGEYTVLNVFGGEGQSGMGVVYLVHNPELPRPIILKTFQGVATEDAKGQFVSEATAWVRAGAHTNIVQAYWVREVAGQLFVAAEYVQPDEEGRNNLTHFLNAGQLRTEVVLFWAVQFCHGMDYARSKGVLAHRDIKPDNLMIATGTLKVTDFGLAKCFEPGATRQEQRTVFGKAQAAVPHQRKRTGSAIGTLPYMAPEQFLAAKLVDHRADVYSFGIVLYQMVAPGRYPYQIRSDAPDIALEFFRAHMEQAPLAVESPLMPVIVRCLEKRADRRYPTYDALAADLNAVATKLGVKLPKFVHVAREDEELYAQAQSQIALGDKDRALSLVDEYVSKYAENDCGWTEKGRIHYERGEYQQGLAATVQSLDLNPYNTHAWNNLGILLNRTGAPFTDVKKAFATALHFDPQNTAAMMNFVGPLSLQKEYTDAAALIGRALRVRPDKPLVLQKAEALLRELLAERQIAATETLLRAWTEARPLDVNAWHNLGLICLDQGNLDQAIECFTRVINWRRRTASPWFNSPNFTSGRKKPENAFAIATYCCSAAMNL